MNQYVEALIAASDARRLYRTALIRREQEGAMNTVSIAKAAELAGVCRRTIYLWMDANKVQFIRTAGGSRRILADTLFRRGNVQVRPEPIGAGQNNRS